MVLSYSFVHLWLLYVLVMKVLFLLFSFMFLSFFIFIFSPSIRYNLMNCEVVRPNGFSPHSFPIFFTLVTFYRPLPLLSCPFPSCPNIRSYIYCIVLAPFWNVTFAAPCCAAECPMPNKVPSLGHWGLVFEQPHKPSRSVENWGFSGFLDSRQMICRVDSSAVVDVVTSRSYQAPPYCGSSKHSLEYNAQNRPALWDGWFP